ncbi:MAG TPA: protein kinase [Acidobacteriota bacterium]|nr:protein kinase [Acidobacteriota bacterium]HNB71134.1 protein kinase [Acidobacteriota bacterium]HNG94667.1 protein kinase [Acidobacteriota bacterium]HNJ40242.1 protein kinase [Acidobacteriota bacterium]
MSISETTQADILVVDDNALNIRVLVEILQRRGFSVQSATNGPDALKMAQENPPDLVLLDVLMPVMNGYQVCRLLRANAATQNTPIIFLSALNEPLDKVEAFNVGATDYISKPFNAREVLARIESQLKIQGLRKELEAKQRDLERRNEELARKNEELMQSQRALMKAHRNINLVFSVFTDALLGTVLDDKYLLEEKIGEGGFGSVYRATQIELQRPVAIKVFRPSDLYPQSPEAQLERFRMEGISACRIQHPNAVSVLDFGITSAGIPYLVMELLNGRTLATELDDKKSLSIKRCAEIVIPVCHLLTKAHEMGMVHRDIKPDNIFLHQSDGVEIIKVVDFGIAKLLVDSSEVEYRSNLTITGNLVGTPVYMSPERLKGSAYGVQSDIYSLGITLYQILCGRLPFETSKTEIYNLVAWHLTQKPRPLRDFNPLIPESLEDLVLRMLLKKPELRPTAREVTEALHQMVDQLPDTPVVTFFDFPPTLSPNFDEDESETSIPPHQTRPTNQQISTPITQENAKLVE